MEKISDLPKFILLVATFLGMAYLLYTPGLSGSFLFDDFPNLEPLGYFGGVTDIQSALRFVFGNNSGPTGRPVSMASFLLNDNTWPSNPYYFKKTNLLLHLASGLIALLLLNRLITERGEERLFGRPHWFCLGVVGLWLLHPINVSTVLYPVQRMAILSAFFSMTSIYFYLLFRSKHFDNKVYFRIGFFALTIFFLLCGVFSKENAALVIPFIAFLEIFYFERPVLRNIASLVRSHFFLVVGVFLIIIFLSSSWWAQGYERRDFTLYERTIYQLPIMGDYILKVIFPRVTDFNLFSGDYDSISARSFKLVDYLRSFITISFFFALIFSIKRKHFISVLGLSWFFVFHIFESTFYPLEAYFEHRNYLPAIGLIVFIVATANALFRYISESTFLRKGVFVVGIGYLSFNLFMLSLTWAEPDQLFLKWEMDEPGSARAQVTYAAYLENKTFPENAVEHLNHAIDLRPRAVGLHLKRIQLICQFGLGHSLAEAEKALAAANHFDMGVLNAIEGLIGLDKDSNGLICENSGYPINLQKLFFYIEAADVIVWTATRTARYYSLKSDFFAGQKGNLDLSVKAIDKAIKSTPTVDLYLKKTVMLASAGLETAALDVLKNAETADKDRPNFYPSRAEEIRQLRRRIQIQATSAHDKDSL
jgi:tetratricopeptide (TPR) repeat protein